MSTRGTGILELANSEFDKDRYLLTVSSRGISVLEPTNSEFERDMYFRT